VDLLKKIAPRVGIGLVSARQAVERIAEPGRRLPVEIVSTGLGGHGGLTRFHTKVVAGGGILLQAGKVFQPT
jgi:hypothetical protein